MKFFNMKKSTSLAAAISMAWLAQSALAQDMFIPVPEDMSIVALGVGMLPDYEGSDDYTAGVAPAAFYKFKGSERWAMLLGPELSVNVIDHSTWQFGPLINYRFGRDGIDDKVVKHMKDIDDTLEAGAFLRWRHVDSSNQRNREGARIFAQADVGDTYDGWIAGASATIFRQVSQAVDLMGGVGFTYASDDYNNTYFGVNAKNVGTSGLPFFDADGGAKDVRLTFGAIVHFGLDWHLGAGVQYRSLLGDAADSPVVDKRGDSNQWIGGLALAYAWDAK
jgi:outer membrane protein